MFRWKLPDWYDRWKNDNPVTMGSLYGPIILFLVGLSAWIFAIGIMIWYSWAEPESLQTGPRGAGMSVASLGLTTVDDPTIEAYYSEEAYTPEPDEPLAKDVYENVQVLGDLTEANFTRLMLAITEWVSPEQGCAYCHNEENMASDDIYTKIVSRRMIQMTQNINENWEAHVGDVGVNCYSCHRGQNVPSGIWFRIAPQLEAVSGWAAVQNYATDQSISTSLPHDALEMLLGTDENLIAVHDLEPRVPGSTADVGELASIQDTERTYSLMNYFSNSLGVNCTFCHNTRAFYDGEQVTPQWITAYAAIDMVREMNMEYLDPLRDTYPDNRLGPKHADAPKAACLTCHKGYQKPMMGMPMVGDWPELAAEGPPIYE